MLQGNSTPRAATPRLLNQSLGAGGGVTLVRAPVRQVRPRRPAQRSPAPLPHAPLPQHHASPRMLNALQPVLIYYIFFKLRKLITRLYCAIFNSC